MCAAVGYPGSKGRPLNEMLYLMLNGGPISTVLCLLEHGEGAHISYFPELSPFKFHGNNASCFMVLML